MHAESLYHEVSPYKMVFGIIEDMAQMEELSPSEAYRAYRQMLYDRQLDPIIYLSISITSGGFSHEPGLIPEEAIALNSQFGSLAATVLTEEYPDLTIKDIIVPSELGKMKGWKQSEYLLFWFHIISGVDCETALEIEQKLKNRGYLDAPGLRDHSLSHLEKWDDYQRLATEYAELYIKLRHNEPPQNMRAVISVLDKEWSLGAQAEDVLCRKIGIPPQRSVIRKSTLAASAPEFLVMVGRLKAVGIAALGTKTFDTTGSSTYSESPLINYDRRQVERQCMRPTGMASVLHFAARRAKYNLMT